MLCTSCIFVVAVELTLATFCNSCMLLRFFFVVVTICFPCLSFFTHTRTQWQTQKKCATATFETMMAQLMTADLLQKKFSTIYFMWQSLNLALKLTSVVECYKKTACIRSQHTKGARCGPDQRTQKTTNECTFRQHNQATEHGAQAAYNLP